MPDDPSNLVQVLPQMSVEGIPVARIKGFRYPAPGSQERPLVPCRYDGEIYNSIGFSRDTTKLPDVVSRTI